MNRRSETLAKMPLFRSLEASKIALLDTQCIWLRAARKEWLIDYRDESDDVFFIERGTARVMLLAISGREVLLREINAGDYFGELAAIDHEPRSAGIVAMTDVVYARMPASAFRSVIHSNPDIADQLLIFLARQVRTLTNRVNEFTTLDIRYRICAELLRLSRLNASKPNSAIISPPPVHAEIAARVSTRRESVARELKALERTGLIERRRGALVLTDVEKLVAMIQQASEGE
jgi:CRP/FNR family cyclic AMP-dependent transcriptional regulator